MVTIYSKKGCAKCITTETLCKLRNIDFEIKKLDKDYTVEDLQKITGKRATAMPVILNAGQVMTHEEFATSLRR